MVTLTPSAIVTPDATYGLPEVSQVVFEDIVPLTFVAPERNGAATAKTIK
jgi:hypothetical protein